LASAPGGPLVRQKGLTQLVAVPGGPHQVPPGPTPIGPVYVARALFGLVSVTVVVMVVVW